MSLYDLRSPSLKDKLQALEADKEIKVEVKKVSKKATAKVGGFKSKKK